MERGTCGANLTWTLNNGTLTINGTGKMEDYFAVTDTPWSNKRNLIERIIIKDGVTNTGKYAFSECRSLTSITIPDSVTSIGNQTFLCCISLKEITIPDSVISIGSWVFYNCSSLKEITIPDSVIAIGKYVFNGCSLKKIYYPAGSGFEKNLREGNNAKLIPIARGFNLKWKLDDNDTLTISGKGDMENYLVVTDTPWSNKRNLIKMIIIKDGVTHIGRYAFTGCTSLTSVTIPDSVTSIGCYTLRYCKNLTSINIPDNVTSIGDFAFDGCESLTSIMIPASVTEIGKQAFLDCKNLTEIRIPDGITEIGEKVFDKCTSLEKIYYPPGRGFEKNLSQGNHAQLIPYNSAPVIKPKPQPVKRYTAPPAQVNPTPQPISKPAPQPVNQLRWKVEGKTLTVGGVSEIKSYSYEATPWRDSFRDIQRIIIEDGVKKIAANAFAECTRLEQLTIPVSVKTIGDGAFTFCYCGDRTINGGRNVIWSLEDGTLMIKKNPAAKNESNFSTGYETWQVVEGSITGVKIERGIVPAKNFFDWVNRMGDGVSVTF